MAKPREIQLGACNRAAGSLAAGNLLYRLMAWAPMVTHKDRKWQAKSYQTLMQEVGLTFKQVRTAVATLRQKGFIVTEQHQFGGKNVLHIIVTPTGAEAVRAEGGADPQGHAQVSPCGSTQVGPDGTTHSKGEKEGEKEGETKVASTPTEMSATPAHKPVHGVLGQDPYLTPGEEDMKASEVLNAVKAKKLLHKPDSISGFWDAWREAVKETYGPQFFGPLTAKDKAQIKAVINVCPEGKAPKLAEVVCKDWLTFTGKCETEAGAFKTPTKPTLGFLLKHVGIAMNMAYDAPKPKPPPAVVPQTTKPPSVPSAPVQLIAPKVPDKDEITSKEELLKLLDDDAGDE